MGEWSWVGREELEFLKKQVGGWEGRRWYISVRNKWACCGKDFRLASQVCFDVACEAIFCSTDEAVPWRGETKESKRQNMGSRAKELILFIIHDE